MNPVVDLRSDSQSQPEGHDRRLSQRLHTEDIVCLPENPTMLGVVTRVYNDDEFEDDEEEFEDEEAALEPGQVEVCWIQPESASKSTQEEQEPHEILDSTELTLIDRSLMHGDIVGLSSNPLGQTGTIVDVDLTVDLQLASGASLEEVSAKRLGHIRKFSVGCYVMYQQWLGKIDEVLDDITVCFEDGSMCEVKDVAYPAVVPVKLSPTDDENMCPYWPGQVVQAINNGLAFRTAKWSQGGWSPNNCIGTVKEVNAGSVTLSWRSCVKLPHGNGDLLNPPSEVLPGSALTPLTHFLYTHFQLDDRCLVPQDLLGDSGEASALDAPADEAEGGSSQPPDSPASSSLPTPASSSTAGAASSQEPDHVPSGEGKGRKRAQKRAQQRERRRAKNQKGGLAKEKISIEPAAMVTKSRTTVAVLWQDGSRSEGLRGADLFPVEELGDYDFWPEEYVVEREPSEEGQQRQCLVKSVDARERTAVVRWLQGELEFEQPLRFGAEEVVSVYELAEHPDYDYRLGDVVTRLPGATRGRVISNSDPLPSSVLRTSSAAQQLEYVGEIAGLKDGLITIAWADGLVSEVGPQNILVASSDDDMDDDGEDESFYGSEDDDDAETASWETLSGDGSEQDAAPQEDAANEVVQRWQQAEASFAALDGGASLSLGTSRFGEEAMWTADDFPPLNTMNPGSRFTVGQQGFTGRSPQAGSGNQSGVEQPLEDQSDSGATPQSGPSGPLGLGGAGLRFLGRVARGWLGSRAENSASPTGQGPNAAEVSGNENEVAANQQEPERREGVEGGEAADARQDQGIEIGSQEEVSEQATGSASAVQDTDVEKQAYRGPAPTSDPEEIAETLAAIDSIMEQQRKEEERKASERVEAQQRVAAPSASGLFNPRLSDKQTAVSAAAGAQLPATKHFELLATAPDDHKFLDQMGQATDPRRWAKRIQTEWASLEASLPDSIFLQVYEGRMDLMRAMIVGAAGTPYHDNLFFFDLHFPPEYPNSPPLAHYHSGGLRVNPNLYETGKVCLSLLNTWNGKGTEVWDATSSMLQVLISLQGLVLVPKPYFNEAGYEKQMGTIEGEKNSLVYNESAYLLVCKSMQYLIKRPPKGFEELVHAFYQRRAPALLGALAAYLSGKRVGSLPDWEDEASTSSPDGNGSGVMENGAETTSNGPLSGLENLVEKTLGDGGCSVGFRIVLGKLAPKLQSQLVDLLEKEHKP